MKQVCSFYLHDEWFAIDVSQVLKVIPICYITPVPMADSTIVGLINMRNQPIVVLDLHGYLGLKKHDVNHETMIVIVYAPSGLLGFIIDRMDDVIQIAPRLQATPSSLPTLIRGVYMLKNQPLLLIDHHQLSQLKKN